MMIEPNAARANPIAPDREEEATVSLSVVTVLGRMLGWCREHKLGASLVLLGLVTEMAYTASLPLAIRAVIDHGIAARRLDVVLLLVGLMAVGALALALVAVGRDFLYSRIAADILNALRGRMFDHLQRLSIGFFNRRAGGEVSARFSTDLATVQTTLEQLASWCVLPAINVIVAEVMLFALDVRLAILAQLVWPVSLIGPQFLAPRRSAAARRLRESEERALSSVHEAAAGHEVIRAFGLDGSMRRRFEETLGALRRHGVRSRLLAALVERLVGGGFYVLDAAVLGVGAYLVIRGQLSLGTLVAFLAVLTTLGYAIDYLMQFVSSLLQSASGLERIEGLLAEPLGVSDRPSARPLAAPPNEIVFDRVTFEYAPGRRAIDEVTVRVRAGERVAIVGPSGSGKTTLLGLLLRFHDPTSGRVLVDGVDLRDIVRASLLAEIGAVFQETFLFNATIADNISIGDVKRHGTLAGPQPPAEVWEAARLAGIDEVIAKLPQGYATEVGERGAQLSGGQRQRIAIARALLRRPSLILLDEATSALDPATEAAVNDTLRAAGKGRTVITATHRLASIIDADRILVLEGGRLVEEGAHEALLARGGVYAHLWRKQRIFDEVRARRTLVDAQRLRAIPLFAHLDEEALCRIAAALRTEEIPAGTSVVRPGDVTDRFFIVARGALRVGDTEPPVDLADGDNFGGEALLDGVPHRHAITATEPSTLLTLSRERFLELIASRARYAATAVATTPGA